LRRNILNDQGELILEKGDLLLNYGEFDFLLTQAALSREETERLQYYRSAFALLLKAAHGYLRPQNLPPQIESWEREGIERIFGKKKINLMTQYFGDVDFDKAVWDIELGRLTLMKGGNTVKFFDLRSFVKSPNFYRKMARRWLKEGNKNVYWVRFLGVNMIHSLNALLQGPPQGFSSEFEPKVLQDPMGAHQVLLSPGADSISLEKFVPRDLVLPKGRLLDEDDETGYFESSA
jgi:hypothetical protein